jgi:hypothetical protein
MALDDSIDPWTYSSLMDENETPDITETIDDEDDEDIDSEDELDHINNSSSIDDNSAIIVAENTDTPNVCNNTVATFNGCDESNLVQARIQRRKAAQLARINARIRTAVVDSLSFDPSIILTASKLDIPKDVRIVRNSEDQVEFQVLEHLFPAWKERHETFIGTSFKAHHAMVPFSSKVTARSRESKKEKAGWFRQKFECHRRGSLAKPKPKPQSDAPEGSIPVTPPVIMPSIPPPVPKPSGGLYGRRRRQPKGSKVTGTTTAVTTTLGEKIVKRRTVAPSIKCGCMSTFNAILKPVTLRNGLIAKVYTIQYNWRHNHDLGDRTDIGTQQKSQAIRDQIKVMYLDGKSISVIMDSLTMDYRRFTRYMRDPSGARLTRDQFISYDDVYNIAYAINAKQMRRATDEMESAALWLVELKSQGYFVHHDEKNHQFHGFSSPWQLEELHKWGDVFCFDGTHHACG